MESRVGGKATGVADKPAEDRGAGSREAAPTSGSAAIAGAFLWGLAACFAFAALLWLAWGGWDAFLLVLLVLAAASGFAAWKAPGSTRG